MPSIAAASKGGDERVEAKLYTSGNIEKIIAWGRTLHKNMATQCPHVLIDGIDVTAGAGADDDDG